MAKKIISLAIPPRTLTRLDAAARADGRSRSDFVSRTLERTLMQTDHDSKLGRVPDARLDRHGSVPRPAERPRGITGSKDGELLDSKLRHIPDVKREF